MSSRDKALEVISKISGVEKDGIKDQMDLVADLGIDSPKALMLLVRLEEALDVEIPDEAAASMDTVADVLGWIDRQS